MPDDGLDLEATLDELERRYLQRALDRIPPFHLADPDAVTWSAGQVRGPRGLPLASTPA